jgi:FtsZ-binding cell division protein ZapB
VDFVGLAALIVAASALAVTAIGLRRKTNTDYTDRLEREVQELRGQQIVMQREVDECKAARNDLQQQNFQLMSKLYNVERTLREKE